MATEIEQEITESEDKDSFSCERCSHFEVCFVRRNIFDFMEQHFQNVKPFEVSELAKICGEYDPIMKLTFEK